MVLTTEQANKIAASQKDLDNKLKTRLALVLADEADLTLEPVSKLIADTIGSAENLDGAENDLAYIIEQLTKAMVAVSSINN